MYPPTTHHQTQFTTQPQTVIAPPQPYHPCIPCIIGLKSSEWQKFDLARQAFRYPIQDCEQPRPNLILLRVKQGLQVFFTSLATFLIRELTKSS